MSVFLTVAVLFSLASLWFLFQVEGACIRCGGRGRHRSDCPLAG